MKLLKYMLQVEKKLKDSGEDKLLESILNVMENERQVQPEILLSVSYPPCDKDVV